MTAPTPETLDWLRQCAAAPSARWHRALLAEVEGQAPPEIEPIPPEGLAWLQQSARVHGATYSQVLLHVLERIELLDKDSIEQFQSNRFTFEAIVRRLEKLEAALQQSTVKESLTVGPTPEAAPVATDEELRSVYGSVDSAGKWGTYVPALRACYDLGRQHGAVPAPVATNEQMREEWARICAMGKEAAAAQSTPVAPEPGEVEELVAALKADAECVAVEHYDLCNLTADQMHRIATLLQQPPAPTQAVVPVAVSNALIKAECALSDVAEGEETNAAPNTFEWAEQRCAETLAIIRPVMQQHRIRTSEWPPQPLPQAGDVEP